MVVHDLRCGPVIHSSEDIIICCFPQYYRSIIRRGKKTFTVHIKVSLSKYQVKEQNLPDAIVFQYMCRLVDVHTINKAKKKKKGFQLTHYCILLLNPYSSWILLSNLCILFYSMSNTVGMKQFYQGLAGGLNNSLSPDITE